MNPTIEPLGILKDVKPDCYLVGNDYLKDECKPENNLYEKW